MAKRDYYDVLGVSRGAPGKAIKSAYRKLARKFHPDVNPDPSAARKFQEATEAYRILCDPKKRRLYDNYGHAGLENPAQWDQPEPQTKVGIEEILGGAGAFAGMGLREILSKLRGKKKDDGEENARKAQQSSRKNQKGQDVEYPLEISFEEAARGTERTVGIRRQEPGGDARNEKVTFKIPAGIDQGARVRVKGKGRPGASGPGDLFIIIRVLDHKWFRREGSDVYVDLPLNIVQATLGASVEVPTLDGAVEIKIPPGCPSGRKLRLRQRGIVSPKTQQRGDQFVVVQIRPPRELSEQGARLLEQFRDSEQKNLRNEVPWS